MRRSERWRNISNLQLSSPSGERQHSHGRQHSFQPAISFGAAASFLVRIETRRRILNTTSIWSINNIIWLFERLITSDIFWRAHCKQSSWFIPHGGLPVLTLYLHGLSVAMMHANTFFHLLQLPGLWLTMFGVLMRSSSSCKSPIRNDDVECFFVFTVSLLSWSTLMIQSIGIGMIWIYCSHTVQVHRLEYRVHRTVLEPTVYYEYSRAWQLLTNEHI